MAGGFPPRSWGRPRVEVFALEPRAAQITWAGLAPCELRVTAPAGEMTAHCDGGPGGVVVEGLEPATAQTIQLSGQGLPGGSRRLDLVTPSPPPGEELFRFATVSDLHLGAEVFGVLKQMREVEAAAEPHALRCGRAALDEAQRWGGQMIVVKGDLVDEGHAEQWDSADALLASVGVPVAMVPGNHEVRSRRPMDPPDLLADGGVEVVRGVRHHDLPGLRLILVDSSVDGRGRGAVAQRMDEVAEAAAGADGPALVAMHHYAQRFEVSWFWPPGIPGAEGRRFLDSVARANPRCLVTSGHTHRNRARRHGPLLVTEVCSTKDFPGGWAGYTVHEGGIFQTVRRTLAAEAIAWTEYTRRAALGYWGHWSRGDLSDRCITHTWP